MIDPRQRPTLGLTVACTACELVYQPTTADFGTGNTGCPQCSGWTWIAQLDTADSAETARRVGGFSTTSR